MKGTAEHQTQHGTLLDPCVTLISSTKLRPKSVLLVWTSINSKWEMYNSGSLEECGGNSLSWQPLVNNSC